MKKKNKLILYHGTSAENARIIKKEGFASDKKYNWKIKSKKGFVYLSSAYSPFYAMNHNTHELALVKCEVAVDDCYPEDDFLMMVLQKYPYTQKELDAIDFEMHKNLGIHSLLYLGNIAIKPENIKVLGIRYFSGKGLLYICDPVISPTNFRVLGDYYKKLTDWIFEGNDFMKFMRLQEFLS